MEAVTAVLPVGEAWAFKVKWDGMRRVPALGDPDQPTRPPTRPPARPRPGASP